LPVSRVHHEVLPNGLTILLREAHLAPVVNLQFWVNVGSADERPGEEGLAHFHEHMLFKGTERRGVGDVAGDIEGAGGHINAYTSFDMTVYYATLPSDALATGVDVLSDALLHSVFDPEEVRRETEVVLEEIRRSEDSPGHVLSDAVFSEAYRVHPYRNPILGPAQNVAGFDREQVTRFFQRWYTPNNLVVVAAGDFDAPDLAARIKEIFGNRTPGEARPARAAEPPRQGLRSVVLERPFERVRLDLAWTGLAFRSPDATHLELLSFILGESESSRLVRNVKEREGRVDRIDSSSYAPLEPGLFAVSAEVDSERASAALEAICREVERVRSELVSLDELERARANFLAGEHFERESVSGMASKLASFQVLGGNWQAEKDYFDSIRRATSEDLLRVAREYLVPEHLTVGVMLAEQDGTPVLSSASVEQSVAKGIETTRRRFSVPRRTGQGESIHSYQLSNGAALHVLPRRDVPVVAVRASFLGGLLAEDDATAGVSSFLASMWMRGTLARSASDFNRAVENLAAEVDGFSGRNSLGFVLEVTSDKLDPTLDLFSEVMLEPAFDGEELERERSETLASIERREDRLAQRAFLLFAETHYESHPYGLPMTGTRESVLRYDVELLRRHHARLLRAENLVIAVSGDVDPDAIAKSFSVRLADLPSGDFEAPAPLMDPVPGEIRTARAHKERAQAHILLGFRGLTVSDPDRHALEVIAQLLAGQGGRLFLELRDRRSLAYSVSASNIEGVAPGFFSIYIATAGEKVEEAQRAILEQLERLISEAPADDEFARAKRYLSGSFAIDRQRNSARAAHVSLDALYGLGPEASLAYADQIESVTKEDLLRVAQRVLRLDAYTIALVGDIGPEN